MSNIKCEFVNAQQMALDYPSTFEAPTKKEMASVKTGSWVKICANQKERFWVSVIMVTPNEIIGVVDNDLVCTDDHGLKLGDCVSFTKENIYQIAEK